MKIVLSLLLTGTAFMMSCNPSARQPETEAEKFTEKNIVRKKPAATFQDTLYITASSAVFFMPDQAQFEKIKAITDSMVFSSLEHDCFYQMRNARAVLKKYYPEISVIEMQKGRYLKFSLSDGSFQLIDLDLNNDPCGLYLFERIKQPRYTDMTNIESELSLYFKK
jgi:hypothetical protein